MRLACLLLFFPVVIGAQAAPPIPDLSRHFAGLDGTFVLLNGVTGEYIRHDPGRAAQRFAPCSTFKIPHTAILLESGGAPDPTFTLKYDPVLNQPSNWARDFDLRDAFKESALWYYQALARRLGMPTEDRFVRQFQYGNTDTSGYAYQAFKGQPRLVYKVDAKTGEETLVRGVEIVGTPLTSINKIVATGAEMRVFNGYCGAESGYVPVSTVAPTVLVSEIELQRTRKDTGRPPVLPSPWAHPPVSATR